MDRSTMVAIELLIASTSASAAKTGPLDALCPRPPPHPRHSRRIVSRGSIVCCSNTSIQAVWPALSRS